MGHLIGKHGRDSAIIGWAAAVCSFPEPRGCRLGETTVPLVLALQPYFHSGSFGPKKDDDVAQKVMDVRDLAVVLAIPSREAVAEHSHEGTGSENLG